MRLLLLLLLCVTAQAQTVEVYNVFGKQDDANWKNAARQIFIAGGIHGRWLTIGRINTTAADQRGFDPSFTYIISKFMPVVKKLPNGNYQIQFTSEIAKDIP
jgi:hypothetical protein